MSPFQKWWLVLLVFAVIPLARGAQIECYNKPFDGVCFGIVDREWSDVVNSWEDDAYWKYCSFIDRGFVSSPPTAQGWYNRECSNILTSDLGVCCYGFQDKRDFLIPPSEYPPGAICITDTTPSETNRIVIKETTEYNPNTERRFSIPYVPACIAGGKQGILACQPGTFWNIQDQRCAAVNCQNPCSSYDEGELRCTADGNVETCLRASDNCFQWTVQECTGVTTCSPYISPEEHPTAACITPCQQQGGLGCTTDSAGIHERMQGSNLCEAGKTCIAGCAEGYAWDSTAQVCQRGAASLKANGQPCGDNTECRSNACAGNYPSGKICCNSNQCGDQGACVDAAVLNADASRSHYCFPSWWQKCPRPGTVEGNDRFIGCAAAQPAHSSEYLDPLGNDFACKINSRLTKDNCFTCEQGYFWDTTAQRCKRTPNREDWQGNKGYCATGCFVKDGVADRISTATSAEDSDGFCVPAGGYINDHLCTASGAWGSRTRLVAQYLLGIAQQKGVTNYELLCDYIPITENIEGEPIRSAIQATGRNSLVQQEHLTPTCILRSDTEIIVGKALALGQIPTNKDTNGYFYTDLGITSTTGVSITIPFSPTSSGPLEIRATAGKTRIAGGYWDAPLNAVFFWTQPAAVVPQIASFTFPSEFKSSPIFYVKKTASGVAASAVFHPLGGTPFTYISQQQEPDVCDAEYRFTLCDRQPSFSDCYTPQCVGNTINITTSLQAADFHWDAYTKTKASYLHCAFDINYFDDGSTCAKPPEISQLAATLLDYAEANSQNYYTLYCDDFSAVLSDKTAIESLNAKYSQDPPIGKLCVLRTRQGTTEKLALGVVIAGDQTTDKRKGFLNIFGKSTACENLNGAKFQPCRSPDLFWSNNLRSIIYSPGGMLGFAQSEFSFSSFLSRVFNVLANPLRAVLGEVERIAPRESPRSPVPFSFDSLYYSNANGKRVTGSKTREAMVITYTEFTSNICTTLKADSALVQCSVQGNTYTVTSTEPNGLLLWRDFTTKLRLP
ncbi:hypothetical protein HY491_03955 [Candidatus Woesearchaeota archaeon]|nr:hypothetical protein [Candidatus Woesearchaeota archaeon]